jgi:inositol phosphorylceramide mannosyltransferase catalytic subunit
MPESITIADREMGRSIPRIIHQTAPRMDCLTPEIEESIRRIRSQNKDWEYRFYNDSEMDRAIGDCYGNDILKIYNKINREYGAARADLFRYLIIYAEGGVYLDIKSSATRPLDQAILPSDRFILSRWHHQEGRTQDRWGMHQELSSVEGGGEYQQWHVIGASGHPFLKSVIQKVINNIQNYNVLNDGIGRLAVLRTTGPIAYTLGIERIKHSHPFRETNIGTDFGFIYSVYDQSTSDGSHGYFVPKHYSQLRTPLIRKGFMHDHLFTMLYRIKSKIFRKR